MYQLVIVRHGESVWNQENRFTGWYDVGLAEKGVAEAKAAGVTLRNEKLGFDVAYTSMLKRAIKTLDYILEEMDIVWIPVHKDWRLNERHYGNLQGLNKIETVEKHGEEQVKVWRRSYDTPPPDMDPDDARHPKNDPRYKHVPLRDLPNAESLKDTLHRFTPLWKDKIISDLKLERRVLIVAHGNSLRALMMLLEEISPEEIMQINIPTGIPLLYHLDSSFKVTTKKYLGDPAEIEKAIQSVANQSKKK
ncbi:MAG: 2,3-diphosphoglycerate-dependent phosphoglycerate mutase [Bdellovibrionaceae bacterium]|nr:2,3-diphosphoglycerate-dependent phosphoglycerate mutase [Pseudobdellovibrionaceae bacterium]